MRKDMSKVIVERPRIGCGRTRRGRLLETDLQPQKQGMRKPHHIHYNAKKLNENLAPLRRFLRSRVGQPWDKVYSEICENIKTTSATQQHVREHIPDFVAIKTTQDNHGQIWTGNRSPVLLKDCWHELYVHPESGILLRNPHYGSWKSKRRARQEQHRLKKLETERSYQTGEELRKIAGIWYQVEWVPVPAGKLVPWLDTNGITQHRLEGGTAVDCLTGKTVCSVRGVYRYDYAEKYALSKRQLSKEELKYWGIENSPTV